MTSTLQILYVLVIFLAWDNDTFKGNITKYGVMDDKMIEWDFDKKSTRPIYSSVYKHDFKAPKAADYVFKRYVTESHYSHQWTKVGHCLLN
jgi:hypothetical protein